MKTKIFLSFFLLCISLVIMAQQKQVSGTVKDDNGDPLIGVPVHIEGQQRGTVTDINGFYSIQTTEGDKLVFSYVGMKSVVKTVEKQSTIDVILDEDTIGLGEVVVVGYGVMKKSDLTGAVSSIKSTDLAAVPAPTIDQMLQGKVAGLQVYTGSGEPGTGATLRIRGTSSIDAGNDPLYVVDGFPIGDAGYLKAISPDMIESIEVLKDASSAAIYGSRGANGVIMITTKKGKSGEKPIVTFSSKTGISNYAKRFDIITDPALYATLDNESRYNAGSTQLYVGDYYDGVYYPSPQEIRNGTWKYGTNWEDVIYRTGITQDYNLSIRGSTDKTQYALSGGYFNQKGIQIGSDYERITAKANINHKVYNFMSVGIDAYINTGNNQKTDNISVRRSPVFPVYDNSGNYFMINSRDDHHPVALVENVLNDTKSFDFYGIAYADFNIIDGLTLRTQAGYKNGNDTQDRYDPMVYTSSGIENKGSGYINTSNNNKTLFEAYATYKKQIRKHDFSIMGGFSGEMNQSRSLRGTGKGFANDVMRNEDLASAIKQEVGNSYSKRVLQSWMVRANYIFDNRFLFTFTGRADGASVLATGHKWNFFPGVAGSWKIHEEEWMKPVNHLLSEAKLRISYGATGNQSISPYATMFRITNQANYYLNNDFVAGYGPGTMGQDYSTYTHIWKGLVNQSLTWERTTQLNLGLDLGFLNQRFYFTADAYRKYTTNLLRDSMLPPSSASDKLRVNNGEVLNKGIELGFGGKVVRTRDFVWNAGVIFAMNRMTVEKLEFYDTAGNLVDYEVRTDAGVDFNADARSILKVGYPLGVFYGYKYDGIIQSYDEGYALGFTGQGAAPGEQKFKNLVDLMDENGNYINEGKIDSNDKTIIGNPEPKFTASLNTSFDYKNFDLSLNFNCVYGNDIFNTAKLNSAKAMIQRWTTDNSNSDYPRQRYGRKWLVSDYFIEDGSYLKLSSATFGYTHYFKKAISSARLYVTGQNLFTLTDFSGYDPETYEDGIYWGGYPQQRVFTMGVNITF